MIPPFPHMQVNPWPSMSVITILPSRNFWPWSGWLPGSSRNTCAGNCLLRELTVTHLPTFWLPPIWMLLRIAGVESLAGYTFSSIEYQKGRDNAVGRCSEPCYVKAKCWSHEAHLGWGLHRDHWKSQCLWPDGGQSRWKDTSACWRNCSPKMCPHMQVNM